MSILGKEQHLTPPFKVMDQEDHILMPLDANEALVELVGKMIDEDDRHTIEKYAQEYWQYPAFRGVYADYLLEQGYTGEGIGILKDGLKDFPENLTLKCILGIVYLDLGEINEAELLMRKWIDYDYLDSKEEIYINTFELLVTFLASYFTELQDDENMEIVYRWTLTDQYESICLGLSYKLTELQALMRQEDNNSLLSLTDRLYDDEDFYEDDDDDEDDDELNEGLDYFLGSDDDEDFYDEDDEDFYDDGINYNLEYYEAIKVNDQPYHVVFKELLESRSERISEDILLNIDRLAVDKQLVHDVHWLVKNAILNIFQTDEVEVHQIWHAMMITGAKNLTECVPLFLETYNMGEGAAEYIFDDEEYFFFSQYLSHLLDHYFTEVDRLLRNVNLDWFHKSTFYRIIANKASEGNEVYNVAYIKTLAEYYSEIDDVDAITWLRQACMDFQPIEDLKEFFLSKPYVDQTDEMEYEPYEYGERVNNKPILPLTTIEEAQNAYIDHFKDYLISHNPYAAQFNSEAMMDDEESSENPIWQLIRANTVIAVGEFFVENEDIEPFDSSEGPVEDLLNTTITSSIKYDQCPCGSGKDYDQCCLSMN